MSRFAPALIPLALALACGGGTQAPLAEPGDREAELRRRVATDPRDQAAQRDLGRIYFDRDRFGAAVRHWQLAGSRLGEEDRRDLANLYQRRASERLAAGDLAAIEDVERAAGLGYPARAGLARQAILGAALAQFRRADRPGVVAARERLRHLVSAYGPDPRAALIDPELASLSDLAVAALWLEAGGANKHALETFEIYAHRGGRDTATSRGQLRVLEWWGKGRPQAPMVAIEDQLVPALEQWLRGSSMGYWRGIEGDRGRALDAFAVWARPAIARMRADFAALPPALAMARADFSSFTAEQQAVVLAELAISDGSGQTLPRSEGQLAWLVSQRARRAGVLAAIESSWPIEAPASVRAVDYASSVSLRELAELGDKTAGYALERLASIDGTAAAAFGQATPSGLWIAPLGSVDPLRLALDFDRPGDARALAAIAKAIAVEPALGERRAREWLDAALSVNHRGPLVVELFARAGDPARADIFAADLVAASPEHPAFLEIAARSAAAAGDVPRALVLASSAAARSGDAGHTFRSLAAAFLAVGADLATITVGRRALELSAAPFHEAVQLLIARAMLRLSRQADAREFLEDAAVGPEAIAALYGDEDPAAHGSLAGLASFGDAERRALAWNPSDPDLLAAAALSGDEGAPRAAAKLAGLALFSSDPRAMHRWADVLDINGSAELAAAARREAIGRGASRYDRDASQPNGAANRLR